MTMLRLGSLFLTACLLLLGCEKSLLDLPPVDSGGTGGATATGGSDGGPVTTPGLLGSGEQSGSGSSRDRWAKANVTRDGLPYSFMANGWGPNFGSQSVRWNGTSFAIESMTGSQGDNYEPASYPTMFCGKYSDGQSGACGLPAALDQITTLWTGLRWAANGNDGQYNVAYDIWLGDGSNLQSYLMVWLRDPPGQQPAGSRREQNVVVEGMPGTWDLWAGTVFGRPIVNYVAREGSDLAELEFDVMAFHADALARGHELRGTQLHSVAIGFEIWNGPVSNLEVVDFYVDVN